MNFSIIDNDVVKKLLGGLRRGDLKFYQFYNIDFSADEYQFQEYMQSFNEGDSTKKILNKSYYDIEVFFDPSIFPDSKKAAYDINAIAVYNNLKNKAVIFTCPYFLDPVTKKRGKCNITDQDKMLAGVLDIYDELVKENPTYKVEGIKIEVRSFNSEEELLKNFFIFLREVYSLFLIGFNSSLFDDPYIVNRGLNLVGEDIYRYMSEFGEVQKFGEVSYEWPDYTKVDLLSMYKPVDQGGNGLGQSLPNYKLDTVAEVELGIKKLDLDDMNRVYKEDLSRFLAYNLFDTLLTYKLDEKLQFLELNWMLAKYNDAPISSAIRGRSIMYRYRNDLIYTNKNQIVRSKTFGREIFYPLDNPNERR
jgi:DNA polymerase elongation subunit (family B)